MNVEEIVELHTCPVCLDLPRPYVSVENCIAMHMTCGVCYSQFPLSRKKKCILCNQPYKKYPNIPGYHAPLEAVQKKYTYNCINKDMGCNKKLNFSNVEEHDKLCEYFPYRCSKKGCGVYFPFFKIALQNHSHLRVLYSNDSLEWNFKLPLLYFYSKMLTRVRLSKNVPRVALLRGSVDNFDLYFRPILFFHADLTGAFINVAITWYSKKIFSNCDVSMYSFLITAHVKTEAGILKRSNLVEPYYLSTYHAVTFLIDEEFFASLYKAFEIAKCVECKSLYPHIHFNVKVLKNFAAPQSAPF